ncbi:DUF3472 domain-containing protein [Bacteroides sp.]|uniref:DUF3472 domain-containing protein n=1 Tax=Bacteroides sp. TaxID=29523 RepID=UPI002FCB7786
MKVNRFLFVLVTMMFTLQTWGQVINVKLSGNAYVTSQPEGARITEAGLTHWKGKSSVVSVYFCLSKPEELKLSLQAKGQSVVSVNYGKKKMKVNLASSDFSLIPVGEIKVNAPGYVRIDISGIQKSGDTFGEITDLVIEGAKGKISYVHDFADYWGRRGPSVHLAYALPEQNTEWFYNEIRVPKEGEIMHSYYMAAGFGEGYFGMQFNSPTERRILFSVWSPFDTQDPKLIPESDRIKLLRRGEGVHIGEFGNEGSGGQSYLKYPWKAGETYKFLMHIRPDGKGNTVYTAYFFATEEDKWRLVASFLRPKTNTWYKNAHSFLENFSPEQGYLTRQVEFTNQWALGTDGVWRRIDHATFTYDATAAAGVRLDYQGGVTPNQSAFYLKMGGFFDGATPLRSKFERTAPGKVPEIDLKKLEKL